MVKKFLLLLTIPLLAHTAIVAAQEYKSSNFVDSNPVITMGGGKATSTNFQIISGSGQVIIGENTSSAFISRAGFFYFPDVTTPVISATAGDGQVLLSWTSAVGALGFNISGYTVGQSTNSGGPYTFTSVGSVLTRTVTGLSNGTTYYFVVRGLDFLSDSVVTSTQVSAQPVASVSSGGGGGGGGGGGSVLPPVVQTTVNFSGRAYPKSTVTLLKDAQVVASSVAGTDAKFQMSINNVVAGNYNFALYSEDSEGRRSSLLTFPVGVTAGATTNITGIFIAPTIAVDKSEVKRGDNIVIFGQSVPASEIVITVNSENEFFAKTNSDSSGAYLYNFDTSLLELGSYTTKSKASLSGEISSFSSAAGFVVGTKTVIADKNKTCPQKADLNNDCRVNLVDFSIAAYWYKRTLSSVFIDQEKAKLSGDGKLNLIDFSIMAYYWTG